MSISRALVPAVRRLCAAMVVLALTANAFDGCLADLGTAKLAMACCQHHRDGCADALVAKDCCQTRNAGTRLADASTIDAPLPSLPPPAIAPADAAVDVQDRRTVGRHLASAAAESPPGSPPFLTPLRI